MYKLEKDRLYVTYFEGDKGDNTGPDTETQNLWRQYTTDDRILPGNKKDNFWEMGDTGPCGPCTEIHIDLRSDEERAATPGRELVNADHPQVVEVWNNVFMEFQRLADKSLVKLPEQSVDTGMGFERLMMAVSGVKSNYDTDVFQPLIQFISKEVGVEYHGTAPAKVTDQPTTENEKTDIAIRVIADHIRTIAFTIADGQLPSNVKAGYVIRRILRRAVRYAFSSLNQKQPFLFKLVPVLADQMRNIFPELKAQTAFVQRVIEEEEISFLKTLENGLRRIDSLEESFRQNGNLINGETAFELSDTFGFPLDLTALIAREKGLTVDEEGFKVALQKQKNRSRNAQETEQSDWVIVQESDEQPAFVGYDVEQAPAQILRYRKIDKKGKIEYQLVLDQTPFYAESGGQVGDTGTLTAPGVVGQVEDTRKYLGRLFAHATTITEGEIAVDDALHLTIDRARRDRIRANHSATHLLHEALRQRLGLHVAQKGSLVAPERLRFDFSQPSAIDPAALALVEADVNHHIRGNSPVATRLMTPDEAIEEGAMALFGEKYGDEVRVVSMGTVKEDGVDKTYSLELCGGTHVRALGDIGLFAVVGEGAVSSGIRRVEALTGEAARAYFTGRDEKLREAATALKSSPDEVPARVAALVEDRRRLERELAEAKKALALGGGAGAAPAGPEMIGDVAFLGQVVEGLDPKGLRGTVDDMKQRLGSGVAMIVAVNDGRASVAVGVTADLVATRSAVDLLKIAVATLGGQGGGGRPDMAQGGGPDGAKGGEAVDAVKAALAA